MTRYAAFLRGMNLGGRRITNDELCARVAELGFEDVWAFLASGNVVFAAGSDDASEVAHRLATGLEGSLGYPVPVFLRSEPEVRSIAAHEPFPPGVVDASAGKLQVALLETRPSDEAREAALALATEADRLAFGRQELYWLPEGPMSQSELDWKAVERAVGRTTVRTGRTIERLVGKLG